VKKKTNSSPVKTEEAAEETEEAADASGNTIVTITDYNPMKSNYHPLKDAAWKRGEPVPYMALARTLEQVLSINSIISLIYYDN